jgi:16S rRNA (guanine527-N7)-methyltransferase
VQAVHGRAGPWQPEAPFDTAFDTIIARAVAPVAQLARLAAPLLAPGGRLVACKGQVREAEAEIAMLPAGWRLEALREVTVPGLGAGRCLVRLSADPASSGDARAARPAG